MIKPYWNDTLWEWDVIDIETKQITIFGDPIWDRMACQDFCDLQNVIDQYHDRGPDL